MLSKPRFGGRARLLPYRPVIRFYIHREMWMDETLRAPGRATARDGWDTAARAVSLQLSRDDFTGSG